MKTTLLCLIVIASLPVIASADEATMLASVDKSAVARRNMTSMIVNERVEYYDVKGVSENELRCEMDKNGCKWRDGKRYDAVTSWHVKWDYDRKQQQECDPDSLRVMIDITFRYPQWQPPADAPQALVDKWQSYVRNLITHESIHRNMAVEAAEDISRAIRDLPPSQQCNDLDQQVQSLSRKRLAQLDAESRDYDARTVHGAKQGAIWP